MKYFKKINNTLNQEYNMNINMTKTKTLVCSRWKVDNSVTVDGVKLKDLNHESDVTCDGKSATDFEL